MNRLVVIATKAEIELVEKVYKIHTPILITGPGALNIARALKGVDRKTEIINVGYAGSKDYPIGTVVSVGKSTLWHTRAKYVEPEYVIDWKEDSVCYTSSDFVEYSPAVGELEHAVFDMELAHIASLGFESIKAYKVISDNLSYDEYKAYTGDNEN